MDSQQLPDDDHHPQWRMTLAVMFVSQFLSGVGFSFVLPFLPFYFRSLGVESDESVYMWVGVSTLVFGLVMSVAAPIWGVFADRHGRKLMVLRSMFAGAVILGLMGLARNPWHILFLRILQGMSTGTVSASVTLVSSVTPSANLGFSLGLLQTSTLLGFSAGPFIGGILADHFGYRVPCGLASVMLLSGGIIVLFGAAEKFVPPRNAHGTALKTMWSIVRTKGFPLILAIFFLVYVLACILIPTLPFFIETLSGDSSAAATMTGVFVGVYGLLSGVSAAVIGRLGDRLGHIRVLLVSLFLAGIISFPQAFADNLWVFFIERCLMGIAVGGIVPSVNSLVSNIIHREKVGSAYGLTASVTCLGIGIGPMIGSLSASAFGIRSPFIVMGIMSFLMVAFIFRFTERDTYAAPDANDTHI